MSEVTNPMVEYLSEDDGRSTADENEEAYLPDDIDVSVSDGDNDAPFAQDCVSVVLQNVALVYDCHLFCMFIFQAKKYNENGKDEGKTIVAKILDEKFPLSDGFVHRITKALKLYKRKYHVKKGELMDLSLLEAKKILMKWYPHKSMTYLFAKWMRKRTILYNVDCIHVLMALASQVDVTPMEFLKHCKAFRFSKPTFGNKMAPYGFRIEHGQPKNTAWKECYKKSTVAANGLVMTNLLMIAEMSSGATEMFTEGMRQSSMQVGKKRKCAPGIETEVEEGVKLSLPATFESHLPQSFLDRLWRCIQYLQLAFFLMLHMYELILPHKSYNEKERFELEKLCFHRSLVAFEKCSTAQEFATFLKDICVAFPTLKDVVNNRQLLLDWWYADDFSTEFQKGVCKRASNQQEDAIRKCFEDMRSLEWKNICTSSARIKDFQKFQLYRTVCFMNWMKFTEGRKTVKPKVSITVEGSKSANKSVGNKRSKADGLGKCGLPPINADQVVPPASVAQNRFCGLSLKDFIAGAGKSSFCGNDASDNASSPRDGNPTPINAATAAGGITAAVNDDGLLVGCSGNACDACPADSNGNIDAEDSTKIVRMLGDLKKSGLSDASVAKVARTLQNAIADAKLEETSKEMSKDLDLAMLANDGSRWKTARIASHEEIKSVLRCAFVVELGDRIGRIEIHLAPIEVTSAGCLAKYKHGRIVEPAKRGDDTSSFFSGCYGRQIIPDNWIYFFDPRDLVHVVRPGCHIFDTYSCPGNIVDVLRMVYRHGAIEGERSDHQARINLGNAGLNRNTEDKSPAKYFGFDSLEQKLRDDPLLDAEEMLASIGGLAEFVFRCLQGIQKQVDKPALAPNRRRYEAFSKLLCERLFIDPRGSAFRAECITLVASNLHPSHHSCKHHYDRLNGRYYGYSKTGNLNVVIRDSEGWLHLLQVIINWRKVIEDHVMPYRAQVTACVNRANKYFDELQLNYDKIMNEPLGSQEGSLGRSKRVTPGDLSGWKMGDHLNYEVVDLNRGGDKPIEMLVIRPMLGISRVHWASAVETQLVRCKEILGLDQRLELMFLFSLLNSTARFYYVMDYLLTCHGRGEFEFSTHPWYDYIYAAYFLFGNWQGGPFARYSCYGFEDITRMFGACEGEDEEGEERLRGVVSVLRHSLNWVDSMAGRDNANLLPVDTLERKFECICEKTREVMRSVKGYNYAEFRLSIFFTVAFGCREVTPGKHLCQLAFPIMGTTASKHLENAKQRSLEEDLSEEELAALTSPRISAEDVVGNVQEHVTTRKIVKQKMPKGWFDSFMETMAAEEDVCKVLGRRVYYRMPSECILCESQPLRVARLRECHPKFSDAFDLFLNLDGVDMMGIPMRKKYNSDDWEEVKAGRRDHVFLTQGDLNRWRVFED